MGLALGIQGYGLGILGLTVAEEFGVHGFVDSVLGVSGAVDVEEVHSKIRKPERYLQSLHHQAKPYKLNYKLNSRLCEDRVRNSGFWAWGVGFGVQGLSIKKRATMLRTVGARKQAVT